MSDGNLFARALAGIPDGTPFSDHALVAAMLRFEIALARSQAELGIIPTSAADDIDQCAAGFVPDVEAIVREGAHAGTVVVPLVARLKEAVHARHPESARYVHHGATSQDVLDSALALCTQHAIVRLHASLERLQGSAMSLARRHREAPVLARTLLQPAGVTTWGYRFAQWAHAVAAVRERIWRSAQAAACVSLGGACGDLAAFGDAGASVRTDVAARLGLRDPGHTWHTWRHDWLGLACDVALAVGTLAKIGGDVASGCQFEVAELAEPPSPGRGASSAMPHKRNPVLAMRLVAAGRLVPGRIAALLACQPQEQERALGNWQAEQAAWPAVFEEALAASATAETLVAGLVVDERGSRANVDALRGILFSDRVERVVAAALGPADARAVVSALCREALEGPAGLEALALARLRDDERLRAITPEAVRACFDLDSATVPAVRACDALLRRLAARD